MPGQWCRVATSRASIGDRLCLRLFLDCQSRFWASRPLAKVSAGDYAEVVVPAVAERLARFSKLRLLYFLGDEFTGFTPGAAWADAKLSMKHFTAFERIAIVTDKEWVESLVQAMGFVLPGQVETFENHEYAKARNGSPRLLLGANSISSC